MGGISRAGKMDEMCLNIAADYIGNKECLVLCTQTIEALNSSRPVVRDADPVSVSSQDRICCSVPWLPMLLSLPGWCCQGPEVPALTM